MCGIAPGYTDVLVMCSLIELELRDHGKGRAMGQDQRLKDGIRLLLSKHTREYRFLSLGSLWPDILGGWITA
ncbi:hypothetical protein F4809DRAFT_586973 [Biscogniauxia mediterranea]|nr:hypothetical protein F4809DRAFT_586973 [Biscogniauxia mediterranea]